MSSAHAAEGRPDRPATPARLIRQRGNSYQVIVYAGIDPLTGKAHRLTESAPTEAQARKILTRLVAQVDGGRNADQGHSRGYAGRLAPRA